MGNPIKLYGYKNAAAINAGTTIGINLHTLLVQSANKNLLPATAVYIKSVDANCELEFFINDTSGDSYLMTKEEDLLIQGENIHTFFVKNNDGSNNIAIGDLIISFFRV